MQHHNVQHSDGRQSGSLESFVFLLVLCTGGGARVAIAQCGAQELHQQAPITADQFGLSLALSGERLLVGAVGRDGPGGNQGGAFIFERESGSWEQIAEIRASDGSGGGGGDWFGYSVCLDGATAFVGAPGDGDPSQGIGDHGSVYVYTEQSGIWGESAKLVASDLAEKRAFGWSIDLDSASAIVGAPQPSTSHSGSAYVFEAVGGVWLEQQILTSAGSMVGDNFGHSVSVEDSVAVVGAPYHSFYLTDEFHWIGAVYVFERIGDVWSETAMLLAPDPNASYSNFGWSVDVEHGRIFAGALHFAGSNERQIVVFEKIQGTWTRTATITSDPPQTSEQFGAYIAARGDRCAAIGWGGTPGTGDVYVFAANGTEWDQIADTRIVGQPQTMNEPARLLSLDEEWFAFGSPFDDSDGANAGAAFVLSLPATATPYCFGNGCPCGNNSTISGCLNSTGEGARLSACGSTSVARDDLVLEAGGLPLHKFGVFFMGGAKILLPFGDGLQCVGGGGQGIFRYSPPQSSGFSGKIVLGPGIVAHSQSFGGAGRITAGETWNFQAWYRDPMGSPCGSGFNLSNAVATVFVP